MKCNFKRQRPLSARDMRKIVDAITTVKCCKCGKDVSTMSLPYACLNFDRKRYENTLCDECVKESAYDQCN